MNLTESIMNKINEADNLSEFDKEDEVEIVYEDKDPELYNKYLPIAEKSEEKAERIKEVLISSLKLLNEEYVKIFSGFKDKKGSRIVRVGAFEPIEGSIFLTPKKGMGHVIYGYILCMLSVSCRGAFEKELCTEEFIKNRIQCIDNIEKIIKDILKQFNVSDVHCTMIYPEDSEYVCDLQLTFNMK